MPVGRYNAMIKEAFQISIDEWGYIPLHQQALAWGVSKKVKGFVAPPDNRMKLTDVTVE